MENINDLNRALFNRLEAFDNDKMSEEELNAEIQKTDAVVKISDAILRNAALALRAQEHFSEYGRFPVLYAISWRRLSRVPYGDN